MEMTRKRVLVRVYPNHRRWDDVWGEVEHDYLPNIPGYRTVYAAHDSDGKKLDRFFLVRK